MAHPNLVDQYIFLIILEHVYFILEFKVNLLFVSFLVNSLTFSLTFLADKCLLQDLSIKEVMTQDLQQGNLHHLVSPLVTLHISTSSFAKT